MKLTLDLKCASAKTSLPVKQVVVALAENGYYRCASWSSDTHEKHKDTHIAQQGRTRPS